MKQSSTSFTTPKGSELPLLNLKGKPYLQVAHRIQWFVEENNRYSIQTSFPVLTDTQTVAQTMVYVYDENGKIVKTASATKRETEDNFSDHTEKAETGSLGRALAMLGYGTQFSLADLDEGDRLADAPVAIVKAPTPTLQVANSAKGSFKTATIVKSEAEEF